MNIIKISKEELQVILEGKYIEGDFEKHYRHNGGHQDIIFEKDGKNFRLTYTWFEDEGIAWESQYDCTEVHQVEKVIKVWEAV